MKIDTTVKNVSVEIEGNQYAVAPRTIAVARKLRKAQEDASGVKSEYELWMDQLKILLGARAVKQLFPSGQNENLDRLELIYAGVLDAFGEGASEARADRNRVLSERMDEIERRIRPLAQLLDTINTKYEMIGKP